MQRLLLPPKLFYFWWFLSLGATFPYMSLYYRDIGLDLAQIGLLAALPGFIQFVASPIWALVADTLRIHRVLLPISIIGLLLPTWMIGQFSNFGIIIALVCAQSLFMAPITPLADSATLNMLGERKDRYGAQRLWGGVGWGISTLIFGWVMERSGLWIIFPSFVVLALITAGISCLLPGAKMVQVDMRQATRELLQDRRWWVFLGGIFLIGCASSSINSFFSLYMEDLGASGTLIGLAVSITSVTELPVMAMAPLALRKIGTRPLLVIGGTMLVVRCVLYAFAPSPAWAIAGQLLHGPCFGFLWTAGVFEAQRMAPRGLEATAQSLFGTVFFGLSGVIANLTGGWLYREFGYPTLFLSGATATAVGASILLFDIYLNKRRESSPQQVPSLD
jgi:PPP family 3-phenylpropionic acid transporter